MGTVLVWLSYCYIYHSFYPSTPYEPEARLHKLLSPKNLTKLHFDGAVMRGSLFHAATLLRVWGKTPVPQILNPKKPLNAEH